MAVHDVLIVEVGSLTFGLMIVEDRVVQSVWIMVWCLEVWVVAV